MPHHLRETKQALHEYALSFPGAYEDFPWGEVVLKVSKKIFVFLGMENHEEDVLHLGVKLPESAPAALSFPFASPMGYNLGKSGWVSLQLKPADDAPLDLLQEWIEESYRAVAPRKLIAQLDQTQAAHFGIPHAN